MAICSARVSRGPCFGGNRGPGGGLKRDAAHAGSRASELCDCSRPAGRPHDLGITPGPTLFSEKPDFVWGLIASMYLSNVIAVLMALLTVPLFARLMQAPFALNGPLIAVVCVVGAWTVAGSPFDLWLMLAFGFVGFFMKALDYPLAPLVLAMVLGDRTEDAFRQSMLLSAATWRSSSLRRCQPC